MHEDIDLTLLALAALDAIQRDLGISEEEEK